jgi:hypothetical protein
MTNKNNPSVKKVIGSVRRIIKGFTVTFRIASKRATNTATP